MKCIQAFVSSFMQTKNENNSKKRSKKTLESRNKATNEESKEVLLDSEESKKDVSIEKKKFAPLKSQLIEIIDDENNNHINEKTPNERENDIDDYQNPNGEPFKKTKAKIYKVDLKLEEDDEQFIKTMILYYEDKYDICDVNISNRLKTCTQNPQKLDCLIGKGLVLTNLMFHKESISHFEACKRSLIEIGPKRYSHGFLTHVYFTIGYTFLKINRYQEAVECFNLNNQYQSQNWKGRALMLFERGRAYYYLNDLENALIDLEEGLKLRPNYYEPLTFKARCLFKMGKYTESITCYDQVTLVHNNNIDAILMERATAYEHTNQFFKAILDCDTVLTSNPNEKEALRLKASCLHRVHKFDMALDCCNELIGLGGETSFILRADLYMFKKQYELAIEDSKKHLETHDSPRAYGIIGCSFYYLKNYEESSKYLNKAVELDNSFTPDNFEVLTLHMESLYKLEKYGECLEISELILNYNSQIDKALYFKGLCLKHAGKYKEAMNIFDQLKSKEYYLKCQNHKASCYISLSEFEKALGCLDEYIGKISDKLSTSKEHFEKGYCHWKLRQYEKAVACFTTAEGMKPENLKEILELKKKCLNCMAIESEEKS